MEKQQFIRTSFIKPLSTAVITALIITSPGPLATLAMAKVIGNVAPTAGANVALGNIAIRTPGLTSITPVGLALTPSLTGTLPILTNTTIFESEATATASPMSTKNAAAASPHSRISPRTIASDSVGRQAFPKASSTKTKAPIRQSLTTQTRNIQKASTKGQTAQRVSLDTLFIGGGFRNRGDPVVLGPNASRKTNLAPAHINAADSSRKATPPKPAPVKLKDRLLTPFRSMANAYKTIKDSVVWIHGFKKRVGGAGIKVKKQLFIASGLAMFIAGLSFIPPVLMGKLFSSFATLETAAAAFAGSGESWLTAFGNPAVQYYFTVGGALVGIYSVIAIANLAFSRLLYDVGNRLMKGLNDLFMKHVLRLPMSWHNQKSSGDVIATGTEAIYTVQRASTDIVVNTVRHGAFAIGSLIGMLYVSWQMTLGVAPVLAVLLAVPAAIYSNKTSQVYKWFFSKLKPRLTGLISQATANMETVKSAGREVEELAQIQDWSQRTYMEGGEAIAKVAAPYRALIGGINDAAKILVILSAVLFIYLGVGGMTIETATIYFFLANYFREAVEGIYNTYVQLRQMKGSAVKFDSIMDQALEDYREEGTILPESTTGRNIKFEGVSFGYREGQKIIENVDLDIKAGESVAFVGASGSGKTTMTRLLLGLYETHKGHITIDGENLQNLNATEYRRRVGTVLQDPVPFAASVGFNISYLRPEASESDIWNAAKEAGLHDEIVAMGYDHPLAHKEGEAALNAALQEVEDLIPAIRSALRDAGYEVPAGLAIDPSQSILDNIRGDAAVPNEELFAKAKLAGLHGSVTRVGYASPVGERGVKLSGGQKQRLLIARLFVSAQKPWDILILDEPTAALDGLTQQRIQDAVESRRGNTTTIMIAHRLSTIQEADKIVVFSKGHIAEQGTHSELMAKNGAYAKLWQAQRLLEEIE